MAWIIEWFIEAFWVGCVDSAQRKWGLLGALLAIAAPLAIVVVVIWLLI